ncbi:hypothetical protein MVEN_00287200 [Mycena venus]|uniref:Uncharacterized protein n=1 Tax=Mycena venus TaxID=2733690 RepID=A0A8H6Z274_9AGAR|nr:hypothetical protein MVEN_00287200 [Mycena venus]
MYPSSHSRSPSRPAALAFHGNEDYDGDVYRPLVSGFNNNPVVLSAALADWPFHVCALIRVPSHFTSASARASWLRRCRLLRFLSADRFPSPPARSPALTLAFLVYPRARPVPCAPLALLVLLPLRPGYAKRKRSTTMNGLIFRASTFAPTTAMTSGGDPNLSTSPRFAAAPLHASNEYAGLIRVLLAIFLPLSVCMRGRVAVVIPSFT